MISTLTSTVDAQILAHSNPGEFADSVKKELDYGPYFGLYKDNYFTLGTAVGRIPNAHNSDVKFQISFAIRLTNATLPWHTYLYLFYTQKTFWNIFENSLPMRDMNFNPGVGWTKPFFIKDRYVGKMTLILEHESNGRDSIASRSWNKISLSGSAVVSDWLMVHAKFWIPLIDGSLNRDILKYSGIFQNGFVLTTRDKKFSLGATFIKRQGWNLKCNTIFDFSWRIHEKSNTNIFIQYYYGYGENLIDYNKLHSRIRAGIVFKPHFFSEF